MAEPRQEVQIVGGLALMLLLLIAWLLGTSEE
jgi:hypothetical protein